MWAALARTRGASAEQPFPPLTWGGVGWGALEVKKVGVLISGRGSNLQALIDAQQAGELGGEIAVVISNVPTAPGLERARAAGIAAVVLDHRGHTREDHEREVLEMLQRHAVDLVCLAGYMRLLSPLFIRAFAGRILNIHPSLLPAFPGLEAQRQALEYGVKISGATVHIVNEGLDAGPIVVQEAVPVMEGDTPAELAARTLLAEHRIYPRAVRILLDGRYRVDGRRVRVELA
jgi:phosphoribosylglycinamide formyltransferase-1